MTITDEPIIPPPGESDDAQITLYLLDGIVKTYELSDEEKQSFLDWYRGRGNGTGDVYYVFTKTENDGNYTVLEEYIPFDKILYFQIRR